MMLACFVVKAQIVSFRFTDIDNIVIKLTKVTVDDTLSAVADCMGYAELQVSNGKHRFVFSNTSYLTINDSITIGKNDTSFKIKLIPIWCVVEFNTWRGIDEECCYKLLCENTTVISSGNKVKIILRPRVYSYKLLTKIDTFTYSAAVYSDTTINVQLPINSQLAITDIKHDSLVNDSVLSVDDSILTEYYNVRVTNMYGVVFGKYNSEDVSQDDIENMLHTGIYIISKYPKDKTKHPVSYKFIKY